MERYQEVIIALSESVIKNSVKRPLAEKSRRHIRFAIKLVIPETMHPRNKVTMKRYQEVMVDLSESVMKNCLKRPIEEITMTSYPV